MDSPGGTFGQRNSRGWRFTASLGLVVTIGTVVRVSLLDHFLRNDEVVTATRHAVDLVTAITDYSAKADHSTMHPKWQSYSSAYSRRTTGFWRTVIPDGSSTTTCHRKNAQIRPWQKTSAMRKRVFVVVYHPRPQTLEGVLADAGFPEAEFSDSSPLWNLPETDVYVMERRT